MKQVMGLSVCIICKDEEKNIRRCLESSRIVGDEIIVVDTGSTDATLEIIREYDVKLVHHTWDHDFAEARNISIREATQEWILILDADEEIDEENSMKLKKIIQSPNGYEGLFLMLSNFIGGKHSMEATVFRVFRRNPLYIFEGRLHEQVITSILKYHSQEKICNTDITIFHYGYDREYSDICNKSKRNLEILLNYENHEKDGYYYYSLGNEWMRAGESQKGIENYERAIIAAHFPYEKPIYFAYLLFNLIRVLLENERLEDGYYYFHCYVKELADFKDLYFLGAIAAVNLEEYDQAHALMEKYEKTNSSHYFYPSYVLSDIYEVDQLKNRIAQGLFIMSHPASSRRMPLVIGITHRGTREQLEECLSSIRKLNCQKVVLTTEEIAKCDLVQESYPIEIIAGVGSHSDTQLKNQLLQAIISKYDDRGIWVLMMSGDELMSYVGLLKLQKLLQSPVEMKAFDFDIVYERQGTYTIARELRLFKMNAQICFRGDQQGELTTSCMEVFGEKQMVSVAIQLLNRCRERFKDTIPNGTVLGPIV